jgi:hypothetical protein
LDRAQIDEIYSLIKELESENPSLEFEYSYGENDSGMYTNILGTNVLCRVTVGKDNYFDFEAINTEGETLFFESVSGDYDRDQFFERTQKLVRLALSD